MHLPALENVWDRLGRADPYWAAVSWDGKQGRWSAEDFFATGAKEIAGVFTILEERGWTVPRRRALDFGCGPGRLSQALAERFDTVDGVDIAPSMLELARRHNRHPERCRYHHNREPDLRLFADGTFDFVYSSLVLQHMPPENAKAYVREMLRVIARGGMLVFQMPTHRGEAEPPEGAAQTLALAALPDAAFSAEIVAEPPMIEAAAGSRVALNVTLRNNSPHTWPSLCGPQGRFAVQAANRWLAPSGAVRKQDDARMTLPYDVGPGQQVRVVLEVRAPEADGDYDIEIDLVQEEVAWFGERGSRPARVRCRVTGGRTPEADAARGRFRTRYPRVHRALIAAGLDRLRAACRRAAKRRREARGRPDMAMYCVPRAEIVALVESAGGQVLAVDHAPLADGFKNGLYWVRVG